LIAKGATFENIRMIEFESTAEGSITNCTLTDTDDLYDEYAVYVSSGSFPTLSGNSYIGFQQNVVNECNLLTFVTMPMGVDIYNYYEQ
jgi:hypothetical protein